MTPDLSYEWEGREKGRAKKTNGIEKKGKMLKGQIRNWDMRQLGSAFEH